MSEAKVYLGDSVYVDVGHVQGDIVLTTENGLPDDPSNSIYLEDTVVESLIMFLKSHKLIREGQ